MNTRPDPIVSLDKKLTSPSPSTVERCVVLLLATLLALLVIKPSYLLNSQSRLKSLGIVDPTPPAYMSQTTVVSVGTLNSQLQHF